MLEDSNSPQDSSTFYEAILNSLQEHIAVIDDDGTIEWVNQAWIDFSNDNGGDLKNTSIGTNYLNACQPITEAGDADLLTIRHGIYDVIQSRAPSFYFEYPCHSPDEQRWFIMRVTPLELSGARKFIISHQTITERKEVELHLQRSEELLKYEINVKNKFFSIISHDLKSPFNALLGMTEIMSTMADGFSKDQLVHFAHDVHRSGEQVFELLHNLLEWARIQMEGGAFEPQIISLHDLTEDSINVLMPIAQKKNIVIENAIKTDIAYADHEMVKTVIRNLIANALKFTPSGGQIQISSRTQGKAVNVTVSDTGVGISPKQIEAIFSLDQKKSTIGTAGETGTGLGLPLCKEMLERNGGHIWVESAPGEGSKFHFTLPLHANT